jgi:hypothetical protein
MDNQTQVCIWNKKNTQDAMAKPNQEGGREKARRGWGRMGRVLLAVLCEIYHTRSTIGSSGNTIAHNGVIVGNCNGS